MMSHLRQQAVAQLAEVKPAFMGSDGLILPMS
jgi:hypothetical protein